MNKNGIFDELSEIMIISYSGSCTAKVLISDCEKYLGRGWKVASSCQRNYNDELILQRTHKLSSEIMNVLGDIKDYLDGVKSYNEFIECILYNNSLNSEDPEYCIPSVDFKLYDNLRELYKLVIHKDEYSESKMRDEVSSKFNCYLYD